MEGWRRDKTHKRHSMGIGRTQFLTCARTSNDAQCAPTTPPQPPCQSSKWSLCSKRRRRRRLQLSRCCRRRGKISSHPKTISYPRTSFSLPISLGLSQFSTHSHPWSNVVSSSIPVSSVFHNKKKTDFPKLSAMNSSEFLDPTGLYSRRQTHKYKKKN